MANSEQHRLAETRAGNAAWKKWGPYLSERQWGTVREDYGNDRDAWSHFSHDQARSRAYRWGEDGLAGISDDRQLLCFGLSLWNGRDPILKERLFGLTNAEGNHGEDVKEYYFYLDNTPTHSYMKYLYKYPQAEYPYDDLVKTNSERDAGALEYELLDTGIFDRDRYFDVFVEYAKEAPEDLLIRITVHNRGPEEAVLHVLPTLWFRNTWSWRDGSAKPVLSEQGAGSRAYRTVCASHPDLGERYLYVAGTAPLLFTENETNPARVGGNGETAPDEGYFKDGINDSVVFGAAGALNPGQFGTKTASHNRLVIGPGESAVLRLRLTETAPQALQSTYPARGNPFGRHFDTVFRARLKDADAFYRGLTPPLLSKDAAAVMRQALAGMLWSKQFYYYDVNRWLVEHGYPDRLALRRSNLRNKQWFHMMNADIISMPDKWEYPWYASWDLAFHTVALAMVDIDFAKDQLDLMLNERYLHPNGQIPAYEWNFGDVNPPVHAWAIRRVYAMEKELRGEGDLEFLKDTFHKLMLNFTWWVNRKDPDGKDLFGGGFLGLDNIGVFDRSAPLPTGGHLEQSDGTAWMAFYCLSMLQISLELALHDLSYQSMASKFYEHFLWICDAMDPEGARLDELWDDADGFFYDVLRLPDGQARRLKVRSLVGLLPLTACTVIDPGDAEKLPEFMDRVHWLTRNRPELVDRMPTLATGGEDDRRLLSVLDEDKLRRLLARMLDEREFLGEYGIRSLSRVHLQHPYVMSVGATEYRVDYLPAESNSVMFGGNSNWRGPIWFPINFLIIRGLVHLYAYYGDEFTVEYPTGSGRQATLWEIAQEISGRLSRIFLPDERGHRPLYGGQRKFQEDPHWRDHVLFYEYFHGDNGAGLGASHQTGWTGLIAQILSLQGAASDCEVARVAHEAKRRKRAAEI